ncbi:MAG: cysteine--tRNA ligase, partial [Muribaculum sp.]|nr:cysteine--tRNA ligase [Muribaculum sp.]
FITLDQFFTGDHPKLEQAYSPMTIRFFILQAQYRSTLDFSNAALQGAEKALNRMLEGYRRIAELTPSQQSDVNIADFTRRCYEALDDDLNTPIVIATLFEACSVVNKIKDGQAHATADDIAALKTLFDTFLVEILGIRTELLGSDAGAEAIKPFEEAVDLLLDLRRQAKAAKDWATSDLIRDRLAAIGFEVKDTKDGYEWSLKH